MVHAAKGTFEVGVCGIYVIFSEFSVFVHHDMGGWAIIYLSMGSKAIYCVVECAFCFGCMGADVCEDRCLSFKDAVHEGYWFVVSSVDRVGFIGFVDETCCAGAPFLGCIVVLCHQLEELEDHVVCGIWEVLYDYIGDGAGAGDFSGSCSLAGSDVVAFGEMLVQY